MNNSVQLGSPINKICKPMILVMNINYKTHFGKKQDVSMLKKQLNNMKLLFSNNNFIATNKVLLSKIHNIDQMISKICNNNNLDNDENCRKLNKQINHFNTIILMHIKD